MRSPLRPFALTSLALVLAPLVLAGCYLSFPPSGDPLADGAVSSLEGGAAPDAGPAIEMSDGYELNHDTIPAAPWLDAPPDGAACWPVYYSTLFSPDAVANLERALDSWAAPCTRFCFAPPIPDPDLDREPPPDRFGLVAMFRTDAGPPTPLSAGMSGHGLFGELRTEVVRIHVGAGRSPSVREWARAIGLATGLRVTSDGLRDGVQSVLRGELPLEDGATATDRGALCRFHPR